MEVNIEDNAITWRFKKLNEVPDNPEDPRGLLESIDAGIFGKQSWEQKTIYNSLEQKKKLLLKIRG